jgi:hypothetical protein
MSQTKSTSLISVHVIMIIIIVSIFLSEGDNVRIIIHNLYLDIVNYIYITRYNTIKDEIDL